MEKTETNMIQRKTLISALLAAGLVPIAMAQNTGGQTGTTGGQTGTQGGQTGTQGGQTGTQGGQTGTKGQTPGQTGNQGQTGMNANGEQGRLALQRSDKIIGADINDLNGKKIGRIDDLVLEPDGRIGYAIISGTTPDTMSKEYPIPWSMVKADMANDMTRSGEPTAGADRMNATDRYSLSFDSTKLGTAPSFERTQWPKGNDVGVFTESDRFFGSSATARGSDNRSGRPVEAGMSNGTGTYFRASQLRNQSVNDASGTPIGTLGQVVIDPMSGRVNYVTFSSSSTAGANGRTVALPWQTLHASRMEDKNRFELGVAQDRLQSAPEFQNGEESWKRMSDPNYVNDVYSYYSVRPYWNERGMNGGNRNDTNGNQGGKHDPNEPKHGGDNRGGTGDQSGGNSGNSGGQSGGSTGNSGGQRGTDTTGGNRPPH